MKKRYLIMAAIASLALVSCSDEEFVGEQNPGISGQGKTAEIVFGSIGKGMTRADLYGADAAGKLNNEFVFAGTKLGKESTPVTHLVFDQYYANWVENTAHTTESNSSDWEYVGYTPYGAGNNTISTLPTGATQSIKYWDYSTTQYDFAAYSLGVGGDADNNNTTANTFATATRIDPTTKSFSITGKAEELKACYVSDLVTAYNRNGVNDYGNVVTFKFRSLAAKIRLAFYETIPGYSVKEVKFYTSDNAELASDGTEYDPTLYVKTTTEPVFNGIPSGEGTMIVTYPTTSWSNRLATDYNKAHVSFSPKSTTDVSTTLVFEDLANMAAAEKKEAASNIYLGRASNTATYAGGLTSGSGKYYTILPYEDGANLLLRIKYTLVSTDGSNEEITVDKATAVIPKELAKWSPNYAYTYIFKISDMTNGSTGVNGSNEIQYGLTPITLNAVVVDSEDGIQETITSVSTPSITTYTQGQVVTANDEYITGNKIYVIVNNGTSNVALTTTGNASDINAKLYTVTVDDNALQTITEESVDNAIRYGTYANNAYTVKDAAGKELVVKEASGLTASSTIAAGDSPTGNEITVDGAYFTAGDPGTIYAFQYRKAATDADTKYTTAEVNTYNAALPGAISITSPDNSTGYTFTSYGDANGNTSYGTGKAKFVSQANGWTTVLVTENDIPGFAGKQYKVQATTIDANNANTYYQLYETNGAPTGIYVKVEAYTYTETDVNKYNATLPGAVSTSTIKPDAYGYKIIKIKK